MCVACKDLYSYKVFKKLLEAEQEALAAEVQRRAALNSENYDFIMLR
jgi:hypothetical protein